MKNMIFEAKVASAKGGIFSESEIRFSNLQKKLLQITVYLNLKFEIPAHNSKQLIQI